MSKHHFNIDEFEEFLGDEDSSGYDRRLIDFLKNKETKPPGRRGVFLDFPIEPFVLNNSKVKVVPLVAKNQNVQESQFLEYEKNPLTSIARSGEENNAQNAEEAPVEIFSSMKDKEKHLSIDKNEKQISSSSEERKTPKKDTSVNRSPFGRNGVSSKSDRLRRLTFKVGRVLANEFNSTYSSSLNFSPNICSTPFGPTVESKLGNSEKIAETEGSGTKGNADNAAKTCIKAIFAKPVEICTEANFKKPAETSVKEISEKAAETSDRANCMDGSHTGHRCTLNRTPCIGEKIGNVFQNMLKEAALSRLSQKTPPPSAEHSHGRTYTIEKAKTTPNKHNVAVEEQKNHINSIRVRNYSEMVSPAKLKVKEATQYCSFAMSLCSSPTQNENDIAAIEARVSNVTNLQIHSVASDEESVIIPETQKPPQTGVKIQATAASASKTTNLRNQIVPADEESVIILETEEPPQTIVKIHANDAQKLTKTIQITSIPVNQIKNRTPVKEIQTVNKLLNKTTVQPNKTVQLAQEFVQTTVGENTLAVVDSPTLNSLETIDIITEDEEEPTTNINTVNKKLLNDNSPLDLVASEAKRRKRRLKKRSLIRRKLQMSERSEPVEPYRPRPAHALNLRCNSRERRNESTINRNVPLNKAPSNPINGEKFAVELKTLLTRLTNREILDLRKRNSLGKIFPISARKSDDHKLMKDKQQQLEEEILMEIQKRKIPEDRLNMETTTTTKTITDKPYAIRSKRLSKEAVAEIQRVMTDCNIVEGNNLDHIPIALGLRSNLISIEEENQPAGDKNIEECLPPAPELFKDSGTEKHNLPEDRLNIETTTKIADKAYDVDMERVMSDCININGNNLEHVSVARGQRLSNFVSIEKENQPADDDNIEESLPTVPDPFRDTAKDLETFLPPPPVLDISTASTVTNSTKTQLIGEIATDSMVSFTAPETIKSRTKKSVPDVVTNYIKASKVVKKKQKSINISKRSLYTIDRSDEGVSEIFTPTDLLLPPDEFGLTPASIISSYEIMPPAQFDSVPKRSECEMSTQVHKSQDSPKRLSSSPAFENQDIANPQKLGYKTNDFTPIPITPQTQLFSDNIPSTSAKAANYSITSNNKTLQQAETDDAIFKKPIMPAPRKISRKKNKNNKTENTNEWLENSCGELRRSKRGHIPIKQSSFNPYQYLEEHRLKAEKAKYNLSKRSQSQMASSTKKSMKPMATSTPQPDIQETTKSFLALKNSEQNGENSKTIRKSLATTYASTVIPRSADPFYYFPSLEPFPEAENSDDEEDACHPVAQKKDNSKNKNKEDKKRTKELSKKEKVQKEKKNTKLTDKIFDQLLNEADHGNVEVPNNSENLASTSKTDLQQSKSKSLRPSEDIVNSKPKKRKLDDSQEQNTTARKNVSKRLQKADASKSQKLQKIGPECSHLVAPADELNNVVDKLRNESVRVNTTDVHKLKSKSLRPTKIIVHSKPKKRKLDDSEEQNIAAPENVSKRLQKTDVSKSQKLQKTTLEWSHLNWPLAPVDELNNIFDNLRDETIHENETEQGAEERPTTSTRQLRVRLKRVNTAVQTSVDKTGAIHENKSNTNCATKLSTWLKRIEETPVTDFCQSIFKSLRFSTVRNLKFNNIGGIEAAFYETEDRSSMGYLRFQPKQHKPCKRTKEFDLHFVVLEGEFRITSNEEDGVFKMGDLIIISKGYKYKIDNISNDIGILMVIKRK